MIVSILMAARIERERVYWYNYHIFLSRHSVHKYGEQLWALGNFLTEVGHSARSLHGLRADGTDIAWKDM
jgi:hypothetical protein